MGRITKVYKGANEIQKVYRGANLIIDNTGGGGGGGGAGDQTSITNLDNMIGYYEFGDATKHTLSGNLITDHAPTVGATNQNLSLTALGFDYDATALSNNGAAVANSDDGAMRADAAVANFTTQTWGIVAEMPTFASTTRSKSVMNIGSIAAHLGFSADTSGELIYQGTSAGPTSEIGLQLSDHGLFIGFVVFSSTTSATLYGTSPNTSGLLSVSFDPSDQYAGIGHNDVRTAIGASNNSSGFGDIPTGTAIGECFRTSDVLTTQELNDIVTYWSGKYFP